MFYPDNIESKLEFDKIRTLLKNYCISSLGRGETDNIRFSTSAAEIETMMQQTKEFKDILENGNDFPYENYYDCRGELARISSTDGYLDEAGLFELKLSLETIARICAFFTSKESENYHYLKELSAGIDICQPICRQINSILDKYGHVHDRASAELYEIRRKKNAESSYIAKTIRTILTSAKEAGYAEETASAVMRGDRLVIPVSPAYKKRIQGIVHDESATGKTVFIEPAEIVEAGNRIRSLEAAEKREIIKILRTCTDFIRPMADEASRSYDFLAKMDFIRAKAKFANVIDARCPQLSPEPGMDWHAARHPLLLLSLQKQGKELVPLDIKLAAGDRILLISGPNAGGKSVCLKTAGLLQYMGQCGLLLPLSEDSSFGVFSDIFIDIGDEQSIENNLSTYSSHLAAMKIFLHKGNQNSLLLIDEFGSGTEPVIGGAIAEAELEVFAKNGCYGIITTHYANLKHLAASTPGIKNAAMLYDRGRMEPLFKLVTGTPGSSFAIEIARKSGLGEEVIAAAIKKAGEENVNYDKNLQDIARDKRYWENKRQQIRLSSKKWEEKNAELEKRMSEIKAREKEIISNARQQANELLKQANATIENTIRKIKESAAEKETTKEARRKVQILREKINADENNTKTAKRTDTRQQFEIGSYVKYGDNIGTVLQINGDKAVVAFGQIEATIDRSQLLPAKESEYKKTKAKAYNFVSPETNEHIRRRNLNFRSEIDVRGMRVDEALQAVAYLLDDATMAGAGRLRILHGTGTGALRQEIRKYLATQPQVCDFHDEHVQLGGAGITIVELE